MYRLLAVFVTTAAIMTFIFRAAGWYADEAALPRYCSDPESALRKVALIVAGQTAEYEHDRRGYIVASKLLFLVPRKDAEPLDVYLERLRGRISGACY